MKFYCKFCLTPPQDGEGLPERFENKVCPKCGAYMFEDPLTVAAEEAARINAAEEAEALRLEKVAAKWAALSPEERHQEYILRWRWLGGGDTPKGRRMNPTDSDSDANASKWVEKEKGRFGESAPDWYR